MSFREQLDTSRPSRAGVRKWIKNGFNRLLRREAKRAPEDAPKKLGYKGYET